MRVGACVCVCVWCMNSEADGHSALCAFNKITLFCLLHTFVVHVYIYL